jgi:hypothetical protein
MSKLGIKKIRRRAVQHTHDEIFMSQKLWFDYVPVCDGVSATANMDGFTVLNSIKMRFSWDTDMIRRASNACNERNEIAVLDFLTPKLFLVPRTRVDDTERCEFYIKDLIAAVDAVGIKNLQFTHYSFINHLGFKGELEAVLRTIYAWNLDTKLEQLVLDTDYRVLKKMTDLLDEVRVG